MESRAEKEKRFTEKAEELGYKVSPYSGRGMCGRECPSVITPSPDDFKIDTGVKGLLVDNMGRDFIVYTG